MARTSFITILFCIPLLSLGADDTLFQSWLSRDAAFLQRQLAVQEARDALLQLENGERWQLLFSSGDVAWQHQSGAESWTASPRLDFKLGETWPSSLSLGGTFSRSDATLLAPRLGYVIPLHVSDPQAELALADARQALALAEIDLASAEQAALADFCSEVREVLALARACKVEEQGLDDQRLEMERAIRLQGIDLQSVPGRTLVLRQKAAEGRLRRANTALANALASLSLRCGATVDIPLIQSWIRARPLANPEQDSTPRTLRGVAQARNRATYLRSQAMAHPALRISLDCAWLPRWTFNLAGEPGPGSQGASLALALLSEELDWRLDGQLNDAGDWRLGASVVLRPKLPWQVSLDQARRERFLLQAAAQESLADRLALQSDQSLRQALLNAREGLDAGQEELALAVQNRSLAEDAFRRGIIARQDLLVIQRLHDDIEANQLAARLEVLAAEAALALLYQ